MRTWILGAAFVISEAIRPEGKYGMVISVFIIVILIAGGFLDFIEFQNKNKEV